MTLERDMELLAGLLEGAEEGLYCAEEMAGCEQFADRSAAAAAELFLAFADKHSPAVEALFVAVLEGDSCQVGLLTGSELLSQRPISACAVAVFYSKVDSARAKELWSARTLHIIAPAPVERQTSQNLHSHKRINPATLQALKREELATMGPIDTTKSKPTLMSFFAKKA